MHKFSAWTHVSNFEQPEHENRTKSVTNGMKSVTNEWPWWEKPKATAFPPVKTGWIFASGVNQVAHSTFLAGSASTKLNSK